MGRCLSFVLLLWLVIPVGAECNQLQIPRVVDEEYRRGEQYYRTGQFQAAVFSFLRIVSLQPTDSSAHYNLGISYIAVGKYLKALSSLKEGLRLDPANTRSYIQIGKIHNYFGESREAIEILRLARERDPENHEINRELSRAYIRLGLKKEAETLILLTRPAKAGECFGSNSSSTIEKRVVETPLPSPSPSVPISEVVKEDVYDKQPSSIIEKIDPAYLSRYQRWKREFLSTKAGQRQWRMYESLQGFVLTIKVSKRRQQGGEVSEYWWDDQGKLRAATITLGHKLDSGYPNSLQYSITGSLRPESSRGNTSFEVDSSILAATKMFHEFGHVNRALYSDGRFYQLQNNMIIKYNKILLSRKATTELEEIRRTIGGTPVTISEERERWAEANTIFYLSEKYQTKEVPSRVKRAVELFRAQNPTMYDFVEKLEASTLATTR
jgi:YD repeat-containing protein